MSNYLKNCQISAKAGQKQHSFSMCILWSLCSFGLNNTYKLRSFGLIYRTGAGWLVRPLLSQEMFFLHLVIPFQCFRHASLDNSNCCSGDFGLNCLFGIFSPFRHYVYSVAAERTNERTTTWGGEMNPGISPIKILRRKFYTMLFFQVFWFDSKYFQPIKILKNSIA